MAHDDVPSIQAECSNCHLIFNLQWGVDCPRCHKVGVLWARLADCEGPPAMFGSAVNDHETLRRVTAERLRRQMDEFEITIEERRDIDWCEKLYALDNEGSTR